MNQLVDFATEQLEEELNRRKAEEERKNMPQPLENPDWDYVVTLCKGHIFSLFSRGYDHDDTKEYIYEAAMEAVYGKAVWPWINARLR